MRLPIREADLDALIGIVGDLQFEGDARADCQVERGGDSAVGGGKCGEFCRGCSFRGVRAKTERECDCSRGEDCEDNAALH